MSYDAAPVRWDHELVLGDTYSPGVVTLVDGADLPLDLTGVEGAAALRREPGDEAVLAPTVEILSPETDGQFRWRSDATDTASLAAGTYRYGVRLTWPDGTAKTIVEGTVVARRVAVD